MDRYKGDGRYDVLEVETRNMKGPRAFDASGLPLHADNQTIVKEHYTFDRNDPEVIANEVTVIDHALTHPWTVTKRCRRSPRQHPWWVEDNCMENNNHIRIQGEPYFLSAEGLIMPAKKVSALPIFDISISRKSDDRRKHQRIDVASLGSTCMQVAHASAVSSRPFVSGSRRAAMMSSP
jgi:hypothetical protein